MKFEGKEEEEAISLQAIICYRVERSQTKDMVEGGKEEGWFEVDGWEDGHINCKKTVQREEEYAISYRQR